jgi:predicted PurR-regulated permease PerM
MTVLVLIGVWLVIHLTAALLVLVAALMLVGALNPLVRWLENRRVRRGLAIAIVFGTLTVTTIAALLMILPSLGTQLRDLATHAPDIRASAVEILSRSRLTEPAAEAVRNLHVTELLKSSRATLLAITAGAFAFIAYAVSVVFLAVYVMIDRDRLRGAVFAVIPREHHLGLSRILLDLEGIVGGYIRGQVITCALMAAFIMLLLSVCHVPNALAIAAFGGVMDLLPFFGIILTMVPAVLAATVKGTAVTATVFVLMFVYEEFEGRILIPMVYGKALRLPSSVVFFSLIAGTVLAGVSGALLALPVAAAALMLVRNSRVQLPGETTLPEDHAEAKTDAEIQATYQHQTKDSPPDEAAAVAMKLSQERQAREKAVDKDQPADP